MLSWQVNCGCLVGKSVIIELASVMGYPTIYICMYEVRQIACGCHVTRKTQYIYCAVLAAKSHRTAACTSVVNLLSCRVRRINATHRKAWKF